MHEAGQHHRPQEEGSDTTPQESKRTEGRIRQLGDWSNDKNIQNSVNKQSDKIYKKGRVNAEHSTALSRVSKGLIT